MSFQESNPAKSWQNKTWDQLLAIAIAILPYLIAAFFPTYNVTVNLKVTLTHILIWSLIVIVILLLLRYLVGERFRDLNRKPGIWWKDILSGIALAEGSKSDFCLSGSLSIALAVCLVAGPRDNDLIWYRGGAAEDFCADPVVEYFFPSSLETFNRSFICRIIWSGPYLPGARWCHPGRDLRLCYWVLLSTIWPGHCDDLCPLPSFCFPIRPDVYLG